MSRDPNDVVKVYSGPLVEVESYHSVLTEAGVECKVVGDELTGGLGTALSGSVELWTHRADSEKALAAIRFHDERKGHTGADAAHPHPHGGPRPGPAPLRQETHVNQDPGGQ